MKIIARAMSLCCLWSCSGLQAATYVVKAGETLYGIAQANGLTVNALKKANPTVKPENLAVGAVLQLPAPVAKSTSTPSSHEPAEGSYEVQPGETLTKIAKEHGLSVKELMALNPQLKPERMRAGQHIRIARAGHAETSTAAKAPATPAPAEAKKSVAKTPESSRDGLHADVVGEAAGATQKPLPIEKPSATVGSSVAGVKNEAPALPESVAQAKAIDDTAPTVDVNNDVKDKVASNVINYRLIKLEKEMTLAQIAELYKTTPEWINSANGWKITSDQVLSVDSEVNVPNK